MYKIDPKGERPTLLPIANLHLWFIQDRLAPSCFVCRWSTTEADPMCERCGLRSAHYDCYRAHIARETRERAWWESELSSMTEAEDTYIMFLCPGCRS